MTNTLGTVHRTCSLGNPRSTDLEPLNARRMHLGNIVRWLNRCEDDNNGRVNARLLTSKNVTLYHILHSIK